jgi:hypothetical protein
MLHREVAVLKDRHGGLAVGAGVEKIGSTGGGGGCRSKKSIGGSFIFSCVENALR